MTDYYLGKREQIAICEEDSWATLGTKSMAVDGYIPGKNLKITPDFSQEWQEVLTAGADTREVEGYEKGVHQYPFTLEFVPTDWRFIRYCAHGTVTNTGGPAYDHTFTKTDAVKSFTLEWAKRSTSGGNEVITLTGCIIKKLTIKFKAGTGATEGFITVTCECVGKSKVTGTSVTTISANSRTPFQFRMVKYTYNSSEVKEVNDGEITIDNTVDENQSRYCNSTLDMDIGEPIPRVLRYNSRINLNYNTNTYSAAFDADTAITGTNTIEFIENVSNNYITFTFTTAVLKTVKNPTNIEGIDNIDLIMNIKTLAIEAVDSLNTY